jgi:hypothetical protein
VVTDLRPRPVPRRVAGKTVVSFPHRRVEDPSATARPSAVLDPRSEVECAPVHAPACGAG